jgi:hypothetical protein
MELHRQRRLRCVPLVVTSGHDSAVWLLTDAWGHELWHRVGSSDFHGFKKGEHGVRRSDVPHAVQRDVQPAPPEHPCDDRNDVYGQHVHQTPERSRLCQSAGGVCEQALTVECVARCKQLPQGPCDLSSLQKDTVRCATYILISKYTRVAWKYSQTHKHPKHCMCKQTCR